MEFFFINAANIETFSVWRCLICSKINSNGLYCLFRTLFKTSEKSHGPLDCQVHEDDCKFVASLTSFQTAEKGCPLGRGGDFKLSRWQSGLYNKNSPKPCFYQIFLALLDFEIWSFKWALSFKKTSQKTFNLISIGNKSIRKALVHSSPLNWCNVCLYWYHFGTIRAMYHLFLWMLVDGCFIKRWMLYWRSCFSSRLAFLLHILK